MPVEPGWYPNPDQHTTGPACLRWWTGDRWTEASMVADSPLIPAAYAAMPTVPPRASMTRREFLYLRTADMVTAWALVRYLGPTMWTGAGLGAVLVAALFVAGVAPRVIVVAVLGVAFILAIATIAIMLRRFHRGQLPPPGVYRIGFGPRRRWDGTGWIDGSS